MSELQGRVLKNYNGYYYVSVEDKIYTCKLQGGSYQWVAIDIGGGGATSYLTLSDKPAINGVTLGGDKSPADLGLLAANGYPIVIPQNTDLIFILRGGVAQMIQVQDLAGQGGGMVKYAVDDYNNPYTFNIPAGATRVCFRFNVESGTIIEKEVENRLFFCYNFYCICCNIF